MLKIFRRKYPQVDIHIIITDTDKLLEHLKKDTVDLVFISGYEPSEEYSAVELLKEKFVVAIPHQMVTKDLLPYSVTYEELVERKYSNKKEIVNMNLFHGIEFIYSPLNSNIQKKRKNFFGKSDLSPYITSNAGRQQLNYNLMRTGFGALFTTDANIATMPDNAQCMYFIIGGSIASQSFSVIYPSNDIGSSHRITKEFVNTAKEYFSRNNSLKELLTETF